MDFFFNKTSETYFSNSAYYNAVQGDKLGIKQCKYKKTGWGPLDRMHARLEAEKTFNKQTEPHKVNCFTSVSRKQFNDSYQSKGWLGRKFTAIPKAFWSGIIKTIGDLFMLVASYSSGDPDFSKERKHLLKNDFKESFGWLATLVNDKFGQYYVEESSFQEKAYILDHSLVLQCIFFRAFMCDVVNQ